MKEEEEKLWSGMNEEEWKVERERIKKIQEKKFEEEKEVIQNG